MGSMHTRLEQAERSVERRIAFYEERARGAVALIITAGYSPNSEGRLEDDAQVFDSVDQLSEQRPVTAAVHAYGTKMLLQILHAGRYAKHGQLVGPSAIASTVNRRVPRVMSIADIERTIADFARTAELAAESGYDGVELMGSEGYLLPSSARCEPINAAIGGVARCRTAVRCRSKSFDGCARVPDPIS